MWKPSRLRAGRAAVALAGCATLAIAAAAAPASAAATRGLSLTAPATQSPEVKGNWNGYIQPHAGADTFVEATWKVPTLDCKGSSINPLDPSTAVPWVGLGGITVGGEFTPLVQIGTYTVCHYGITLEASQVSKPVYEVVYKNLSGTGEKYGSQPLSAGNLVVASVQYEGNGEYLMDLENVTRGWNWEFPVTVTNHNVPVSADYVVESGVDLYGFGILESMADFGKFTFTEMYYKRSGSSQYIGLTDSKVDRIYAGSPPQAAVDPVRASSDGGSGVIQYHAAK